MDQGAIDKQRWNYAQYFCADSAKQHANLSFKTSCASSGRIGNYFL